MPPIRAFTTKELPGAWLGICLNSAWRNIAVEASVFAGTSVVADNSESNGLPS
jgi:hypothetical protein